MSRFKQQGNLGGKEVGGDSNNFSKSSEKVMLGCGDNGECGSSCKVGNGVMMSRNSASSFNIRSLILMWWSY